jgi:Xaa-Pro aminopeptidase
VIEPGMIIAIEPRVTFGAARVHYEDMFLVTPTGPKNLSGWKDVSKMLGLGE